MELYLQRTLPLKAEAFDIFLKVKDQPHAFFLDSGLHGKAGSFSFIGFSPFAVVEGCTLADLDRLRSIFNTFKFPDGTKTLHPFVAGMAGYISYDFGLCMQGMTPVHDRPAEGFFFGFYDCMVCIDHATSQMHITSTGFPETDPHKRRQRAQERLDEVTRQLEAAPLSYKAGAVPALTFDSNFTQDQYVKIVRRSLDHIRAGDIYQINVSRKVHAKAPGLDPIAIYQALRRISPSDHSAYFNDGHRCILSSSPERFVALQGRRVHVKPMKGTRPRGTSPHADTHNRHELETSVKEIAELLMVTDLERNDLGRVCEYGSVRVADMRSIEEYSTVFQATSTIEGILRRDCDGFDVLKSCFPSGSVTGCPKIAAMSIIDRLETTNRGLYTGALGYMSFTGDMDFNVLIRTLLVGPDGISFNVGGGIVADSDPRMEYEETVLKARAMVQALGAT